MGIDYATKAPIGAFLVPAEGCILKKSIEVVGQFIQGERINQVPDKDQTGRPPPNF